jgi:hypothetical protein
MSLLLICYFLTGSQHADHSYDPRNMVNCSFPVLIFICWNILFIQLLSVAFICRYGAPPGLFCAPKSVYPHTGKFSRHLLSYQYNNYPNHVICINAIHFIYTGFWDYSYWCDNPWNNPPEYCDVYEDQKSGRFDNTNAVPNMAGRTDVEGCWYVRSYI